jgi:hypothetical protein
VFTTLTQVNIRDGNLPVPARLRSTLKSAIEADLDAIAVTIWLLLLALLVVTKYGSQLFG